MLIAVPAESQSKEKRVAATPDSVGRFIAAGCDVVPQVFLMLPIRPKVLSL